MKNIQKLMLMAFMMVASSTIIQAATTCTVQMKNSTGYTILESTDSGDVITTIKNGTTLNQTVGGGPNGNYSIGKKLSLKGSGGSPNYNLPSYDLGKSCPASSAVYNITLDKNNMIQIAAA